MEFTYVMANISELCGLWTNTYSSSLMGPLTWQGSRKVRL